MSNTAILSVRITGDGRDASRAFKKVQKDADAWQRHMRSMGVETVAKGLSSAARAASHFSFAIAAVGAGAPIAAAAILAIGAAAVGLAAIGGAAFAVIKLGMDGIKKAAATASPAFNALKTAVSGALEKSMIPGFQQAGDLMTAIQPQMVALANTIGTSFSDIMTGIRDDGASEIRGIITNAQTFIQGITPGLTRLLLGILSFAEAGSKVMANFAPQINGFLQSLGEKLGSITPEQIVAAFERLRNTAQEIGSALSPVVSALQTMAQHAQLMFTLAVALKAIQIAIAAVALAQKVWTAAQWLFNAAMAANPITIIILAIIALVAIIVLIATKTTWFQTIWHAMCSFAAAAWDLITSAVSAFVGWIVGVWNSIVSGATAAWNWVSNAASVAWDAISSVVSTVAGVIGSVISAAIDVVVGVFNTVKGVAETVWGGIKSVIDTVAGAISTVVGWIQTLINWISNIHWPSPPSWLSAMFGGPAAEFRAIPMGAESYLRFLPDIPSMFAAPAPALMASATPDLGSVMGRGGMVNAPVTNIHITVQGAVDPVSTARQVDRLLRGRDRSIGLSASIQL